MTNLPAAEATSQETTTAITTHGTNDWQQITAGQETRCAGGSPYAYYIRQVAESHKLLIFFQGGGGCPDGVPCDPANPGLFDPSVFIATDKSTHSGTAWDSDNPAEMDGIFKLTDLRNPFRDFNMLFIPYCTADAHLGQRKNGDVHHNGYINATTAMQQALPHFPPPEQIVVAGTSAGAIAAPFYAGLLAEQYPASGFTVLGDSAGGYARTATTTRSLQNWGADQVLLKTTGYEHVQDSELDFESAWLISSKRHPEITFARFNTLHDAAQQQFLTLLGGKKPVDAQIRENLATLQLQNNGANSSGYTVNDSYHTILSRPHFYTEQAEGVFFYQWVTTLIQADKS